VTGDLVERLRHALDERERVAIAASGAWDSSTPTGEHWHWECTNCDTPIPITPVTVLDEMLQCPACDGWGIALRSDEQYPTSSFSGTLSHHVVSGTEEVEPVSALHIQMHDPAHVLSTIQAHRRLLGWADTGALPAYETEYVITTIAAIYLPDIETGDTPNG
jgi:hypothetical protein